MKSRSRIAVYSKAFPGGSPIRYVSILFITFGLVALFIGCKPPETDRAANTPTQIRSADSFEPFTPGTDPKQDFAEISRRFLSLGKVRATSNTVRRNPKEHRFSWTYEYLAPNRYRELADGKDVSGVAIDGAFYRSQGNGTWRVYRSKPDTLFRPRGEFWSPNPPRDIQRLDDEIVDGSRVFVYTYRVSMTRYPAVERKFWVGSNGLPLKMEYIWPPDYTVFTFDYTSDIPPIEIDPNWVIKE